MGKACQKRENLNPWLRAKPVVASEPSLTSGERSNLIIATVIGLLRLPGENKGKLATTERGG